MEGNSEYTNLNIGIKDTITSLKIKDDKVFCTSYDKVI